MDSRVETYKHIQTVQKIMGGLITDLQKRALVHDQSKLVSPEVEVFDEYTPKLATSTYGSEEYKSFLAGMKPALDHHYATNSHHPEHFPPARCCCRDEIVDGQDSPDSACTRCCGSGVIPAGIREMSLLDLVEMLADWKAATLRHAEGDIRKSIEINQKRFGYGDELKGILLNTLSAI